MAIEKNDGVEPRVTGSEPSDAERRALEQSGRLMRFASENVANLPSDLFLAIAEARQACAEKTWTPEISKRFWTAFNALSIAIKPVTIEGLSALAAVYPRRIWYRFWTQAEEESLAGRNSRRLSTGLMWLLVLIVLVQLLTWTISNVATSAETQSGTTQAAMAEFAKKCQGPPIGPVSTLPELRALDGDVARLTASTDLLDRVSPLEAFRAGRLLRPGAAGMSDDWIEVCSKHQALASATIDRASAITTSARLFAGILLQFLLPVLLATIGALAYVLRNTSEQIKEATFSATSPVRNLVRIVLGALMGVVIGLFTDVSSKLSLQPLAIAFLAGYGVEPVFSWFDSLIARLK